MPCRRIALVSYFHDGWRSDWGGELIIYAKRKAHAPDQPDLEVTHCIEPRPGSLVMFTVPSTASVGWIKSQVISGDSQLPDGSMTDHP